jgi:Dihaem cytochrome c
MTRSAITVAALTAILAAGPAGAATTGQQMFQHECSACHFAYPAEFLPRRSWQAITGDLSHHFGEDASLDPDTTKAIAGYLDAHAADAPGVSSPFTQGLKPTDVPLQITDTPVWKAIHRQIDPSAFTRPDIKTKANCLACHGGG